ncbi:MAG: hypothetical protein GY950_21950 [bacterium]|nr:hypothetical protein [bacterium]
MNENQGTLELIARHLALALKPLKDSVGSEDNFRQFMYRLGWNVTALPAEYSNLVILIDDAIQKLDSLSPNPSFEDIKDLLEKIKNIYDAIQSISAAPPGVDAGEFLSEIGERLFEILLIDYLVAQLPDVYNIFSALDIIEVENLPPSASKHAFIRTKFKWEEIPKVIADPLSIPLRVYGWGTDDLDFNLVIEHISELFFALEFPVAIREVDEQLSRSYSGITDAPYLGTNLMLKVPFYYITIADKQLEASFALLELPGSGGKLPGIILEPQIPSEFPSTFHLADDIDLEIRAGSNIVSQFGILIRPGQLDVKYPFKPGEELPSAGFGISFDFHPGTSVVLLGSPDTTRLQLKGAAAGFEVNYLDEELEVILDAELKGLTIIVKAGEGDSFLKKITGDKDLNIEIPMGIEWSSTRGLHFKGGGGFEVELPLHHEIGPIIIDAVHLQAKVPFEAEPMIKSYVGVNIAGQLGPLSFAVEDIGIKLDLAFVDGNAGPFDIDVGFKWPTGIGLSINGGGFKGGGSLRFDPANKRYEGMLELEFQDKIALKAIGLLTTQLPGGKEGFSLLIIITAEFTPIQLGFGFTLNGVGGLLGLNRTAKIERLRTGVKDNTLSSVLFPTDIVVNANRIISDLRQVFPAQEGRFIFGPMAKIAWGTPPLITIDLGLLIEVPDPVRLVILGVVKAVLPDEKAAFLRLQVNFLGDINFEKKQLSFDASLFDSKLLSFPLSGDMAIRLNWGSDPNFLLTVGGFHPAYEPPPMNLPNLRRLTLQLLKGNNPRLTLETYFAVTSNTAQFGAKLELYAAKGRFNVYGFLSFDALFQFNPFYFIAEVSAMLALRVGSSSIASIKLDLTLEGTTPWKAHGTAKLKLCWFLTVKVRFNKTFGEERDTTLPAIEVMPLLEAALSADGNWQPQIPGRSHLLVSLKQIETTADTIIAHPFGSLEISQKVVPLNIPIDKFGNQKPGDGNEFRIKDVTVGTEVQDTVDTEEFFAPAQFFEKTDLEKLSGKSFEKYDSGIRIASSGELKSDYYAKRDVEYELFYIDSQRDRLLLSRFDRVAPDADAFNAWAVNGAIADSDLSFAKNAKSALAPDEVTVGRENFAVVNISNLTVFDDDSLATNEEAALYKMGKLVQDNPALEGALQVVPRFEINPL